MLNRLIGSLTTVIIEELPRATAALVGAAVVQWAGWPAVGLTICIVFLFRLVEEAY